MPNHRRSEFDVCDKINTTDYEQVAAEIDRMYSALYDEQPGSVLQTAFQDAASLYRGDSHGYHACDTEYHDIQHVLDVTLAMARIMDGCKRATNDARLDATMFRLGIIAALYHDVGYIRSVHDTRHKHGAEYTVSHVGRGAVLVESYLHALGMHDEAHQAAQMLHYTGYETPINRICVAPKYQLVGSMLGSADILAQMADRCYLEKCHRRLYPEFVLGGIVRKRDSEGREIVVFASASDLIYKTPGFYAGATKRLAKDLGNYSMYLEQHFGGDNIYFEELEKNFSHARQIAETRDMSLLRRSLPETLTGSSAAE